MKIIRNKTFNEFFNKYKHSIKKGDVLEITDEQEEEYKNRFSTYKYDNKSYNLDNLTLLENNRKYYHIKDRYYRCPKFLDSLSNRISSSKTCKKLLKNRNVNIFIFILCVLSLEICFSFIVIKQFLPYFFFLDIFILILFSSITLFFKKTKFDVIYFSILMFLYMLMFSLNTAYYKITGNIFALSNLSNLSSLFKRTGDHLHQFPLGVFFIFLSIYAVFEFALILFNVKKGEEINRVIEKSNLKKRRTKAAFLLASATIVYSSSFAITAYIDKSIKNNSLKQVAYACNFNTKRYGLPSYYILEILDKIFFSKPFSMEDFNNYFKNGKKVQDEFTGKLKIGDYNVISISFETGQKFLLNQYTMPNTYNLLYDNGIVLENCYSTNNTFPSEMLGIAGNGPSYLLDTARKYNMPFSLPNILRKQGNYITSYYCDLDFGKDPFSQSNFIPEWGFQNNYGTKHLMQHRTEPINTDYRALVQISEDLNQIKKPFYIHYTSFFTHYPYINDHYNVYKYLKTKDNGRLTKKLDENDAWNLVKDESKDVQESFRNYTIASMDFDDGIGELVKSLKNNNLFDNTIIVIYGDHDYSAKVANGFSMTENVNKTKGDYYNIKNFNTIFGFANKKLKTLYESSGKQILHNFTSPMNVVPTLLDILGTTYNPNFYQGKSIFQDDFANNENVFYSENRHVYLNEHYFSSSGVEIDRIYNDNFKKKEFLDNCSNLAKQMTYLDYIYGTDFFGSNNYEEYLPK